MQNKGAIRLFAIILSLVCLFQISFTFVTRNIESEAREFAAGDTAKERQYLDSLKNEKVYLGFTYADCKARELVLGLDLQGGMNITMEVATVDVVRALSGKSTDPAFNKAIDLALKNEANSGKDFITLFAEAAKTVNPNNDKWLASPAVFGRSANKDIDPFKSTNEDVIKFLRARADEAIDQTFQVLRTRIDKFGVTSPNIQKLGSTGRILVELPGVKDKARVRKLLQGTANLEFWETYDNKDIYPYFTKIDEKVKAYLAGDSLAAATADTLVVDTTKAKVAATAVAAKVDTAKKKTDTTAAAKPAKKDSLSQAEKAEKAKKDAPFSAILAPVTYQTEDGKQSLAPGAAFGITTIKDTATVNKYLNLPQVKAILPPGFKAYWASKPLANNQSLIEVFAIRVRSNDGSPALSGEVIVDARADYQQNSSEAKVSMQMNGVGANKWKRLTKDNVGHAIAIVLDGYVYSAPNVNGEIPNGSSEISGSFDINEAKDLANVLKAGKMPAPARIVQDVVVGPSLGEESINNGFYSFLIALALVLLFMGFYYSTAGWIADLALFANLFFLMGVLVSLGLVLTLPGIAGLVLTVAMSVDANVLIYERVREELHAGKGLRLAIADGFKMAYSSIIDANVTTIIVGVVLFVNGTGPVQGFATTLVIGILTSLFSAIFITRLIFEALLDRNKTIKFYTSFTEHAFKNIKFNWIGNRNKYYILSGLITLAGIASLAIRGLNYGVDFKGGRSYVVRFDNQVGTVEVATALAQPFGGTAPEVKTFGGDNQVKITTKFRIDEKGAEVTDQVEKLMSDALSKSFPGNKAAVQSSDTVGPTVADDIKRTSLFSFLLSVLGIFIYIVIRFRKWEFGLGAIISLVHDAFMVLSVFSIFYGILPFNLEIDQAFIAAVLTVMGYSINDTVVVFDRIREYSAMHKREDMKTFVNDALNSTLSRTINTSLTIFFVLLAIFIFGGEVIRGFSFALLVGIVVGTYSSLCIATPIVVDMGRYRKQNKEVEEKK